MVNKRFRRTVVLVSALLALLVLSSVAVAQRCTIAQVRAGTVDTIVTNIIDNALETQKQFELDSLADDVKSFRNQLTSEEYGIVYDVFKDIAGFYDLANPLSEPVLEPEEDFLTLEEMLVAMGPEDRPMGLELPDLGLTIPEDLPSNVVQYKGMTIVLVGDIAEIADEPDFHKAFEKFMSQPQKYLPFRSATVLASPKKNALIISSDMGIYHGSLLQQLGGLDPKTLFRPWYRVVFQGGFEPQEGEIFMYVASIRDHEDDGIVVKGSEDYNGLLSMFLRLGFSRDKALGLQDVSVSAPAQKTTLGVSAPVIIPENVDHIVVQRDDVTIVVIGEMAKEVREDTFHDSLTAALQKRSGERIPILAKKGLVVLADPRDPAEYWHLSMLEFLDPKKPDFTGWWRAWFYGGLERTEFGLLGLNPTKLVINSWQKRDESGTGLVKYESADYYNLVTTLKAVGFSDDKEIDIIFEDPQADRKKTTFEEILKPVIPDASATTDQNVYFFSQDEVEGLKGGSVAEISELKYYTGGKHAAVAANALAKLPVPPGFAVAAKFQSLFENEEGSPLPQPAAEWDSVFEDDVLRYFQRLEQETGQQFGNSENPLLVSVRSGAAVSLPGLLETVLNLGINDEVAAAFAEENPRFAWDTYRRFLESFGRVALDIPQERFDEYITPVLKYYEVGSANKLSDEGLETLVDAYKKLFIDKGYSGVVFDLADGRDGLVRLLKTATEAVYRSWYSDSAVRERQTAPEKFTMKFRGETVDVRGTSVTVQQMVFGNKNDKSGAGVVFTRNPSTGEDELFAEWHERAQGEDVVAGRVAGRDTSALDEMFPKVAEELGKHKELLEDRRGTPQDIEFTIEDGELFILQSRDAMPTMAPSARAVAGFGILEDQVAEGHLTEKEAFTRVVLGDYESLLSPHVREEVRSKYEARNIAAGVGSFPGTASGVVVTITKDMRRDFEAFKTAVSEALKNHPEAEKVVLFDEDNNPLNTEFAKSLNRDVLAGIVAKAPGLLSHAMILIRGEGIPVISSNPEGPEIVSMPEGELVSLWSEYDGEQVVGRVVKGAIAKEDLVGAAIDINPSEWKSWADVRDFMARYRV